MRNQILLICILIFTAQLSFAVRSNLNSPTELQTRMSDKIDKIKTEKSQTKKIKLLKELKEHLKIEAAAFFQSTEKLYEQSLELQTQQTEKKSQSSAKEIVRLNKKFVDEKEIYELLIAFEEVFKNTFLVFLENKKSEFTNCSTLGDDIERSHLSTLPEGSLLPYHAKLAIELVDTMCSSISKE